MTEIKQIVVSGDDHNAPRVIFGLGDDSLVYSWDDKEVSWILYKVIPGVGVPF